MPALQSDRSNEPSEKRPGDWLYLFGRSGLYGLLIQLFGNRFLALIQPSVRFKHAAIAVAVSGTLYFGAIHALRDFTQDILSPSRCSQARSPEFPSTVSVRASYVRGKCLAGGLPPHGYLAPADTVFVSSGDAWGYRFRKGARSLSGWMLFLSFMLASMLWRREETKETYAAVFGKDSDEYKRVAKFEIPEWKPSDEADDWLINPPKQSGIDPENARSNRPVFGRKSV